MELGGRRDLASWQGGKTGLDWLSFRALGRTFGCREKQEKMTNKDSNKGGPTSYLQVFSSRYVIVSTLANSVQLNFKSSYAVIIFATCTVNNKLLEVDKTDL